MIIRLKIWYIYIYSHENCYVQVTYSTHYFSLRALCTGFLISPRDRAEPWNFPNAHGPDHTGSKIMGFGSTEFTDTQVFEAGHKSNVIALANLTNRKDQFYCIARHNDRTHIYPRSASLCLGTQRFWREGGSNRTIQAALTQWQIVLATAVLMTILPLTSAHLDRVS